MHNVIAESKTFSKILVAIDELKTSAATTNKAIDYAVNIARDYDVQLIILHVIRADARAHGINPPSHIIEMKRQAEANFVEIIEKIQENTTNNIKKNILKIKTDIIASIRVADAIKTNILI
jgi:nucleotide-binding universal stress UspA family protein